MCLWVQELPHAKLCVTEFLIHSSEKDEVVVCCMLNYEILAWFQVLNKTQMARLSALAAVKTLRRSVTVPQKPAMGAACVRNAASKAGLAPREDTQVRFTGCLHQCLSKNNAIHEQSRLALSGSTCFALHSAQYVCQHPIRHA